MYKLLQSGSIRRLSDDAHIPTDESNLDYLEYLAWIGEGNTPDPADPISPPLPIEQIRALEAPWDDDFKKIQRQFLIAALFREAKAHPLAAGKTDAEIHAELMLKPDKGYAKLYALEQQIIPIRALIP